MGGTDTYVMGMGYVNYRSKEEGLELWVHVLGSGIRAEWLS